MKACLVSLHSPTSQNGGIGVLDPAARRVLFVQMGQYSPRTKKGTRGLSILGERIHAVTSNSLQIWAPGSGGGLPLRLEREIFLPQWNLGGSNAIGLLSVLASPEREVVYVGDNATCAVDVFTPEGKHLDRRHLWEIAPDLFPLPGTQTPNFLFGTIKTLSRGPEGDPILTVTAPPPGPIGLVFRHSDGHCLLADRNNLNSGLVHDARLHFLEGANRTLASVDLDPSFTARPGSEKRIPIAVLQDKWQGSVQSARGLHVEGNEALCGVCHFGKSPKNQIPPRAVLFDLRAGCQTGDIFLPSAEALASPRIFDFAPLPAWMEPDLAQFSDPDAPCMYFAEGQRTAWIATLPDPSDPSPPAPPPAPPPASEPKPGPESEKKQAASRAADTDQAGSAPAAPQAPRKTAPAREEPAEEVEPPDDRPVSIQVKDVHLCFRRSARSLFSGTKSLRSEKRFWALRGVSFTARQGDIVGIIGRNGSGKSTISQVLAGVLVPDRGQVETSGRVQLLALGVGFRNELTGRDNVFISGALLGLSKRRIAEHMDEIEEFTELGHFLDEPIRTYSSGMRSRLGFAVSTIVRPDILILDEVLSTGDAAFRKKAMARMQEMHKRAGTIVMVSHNPAQLRKLCTRAIWMERGVVLMDAPPKDVLNHYSKFCDNPPKWLEKNPGLAALLQEAAS